MRLFRSSVRHHVMSFFLPSMLWRQSSGGAGAELELEGPPRCLSIGLLLLLPGGLQSGIIPRRPYPLVDACTPKASLMSFSWLEKGHIDYF